jgi:hypothetical protein
VVHGPEQRVVVVMVEVEDALPVLQRVGRVPVDVAAVQEDHRAVLQVLGQLRDELGQDEEAVLVGQRELVRREVGDRVLAQPAEHVLHRGQGAERVPVRVLVRGEHEAVADAQRLEHALARGGVAVHAHVSPPPSSCSASRRAMRMLRSVVSS